jgi:rRNA-processing protein FCF1
MAKYNELLLDANFIIEATKRRILDNAKGLVPGARLVTLQAVVDELEKNKEKLALKLIGSEGIEIKPITGYADKAIEEYAEEGGVAVATNDKELKHRLRAKGVAVVFPQKSGCGFLGGIV